MYSAFGIAELPQLLFGLKAGRGNALQGKFVENFVNAVSTGISFGAFFTHECRDEFDPVTPARYLAIASAGLDNSVSVTMKSGAHAVSLSSQCGLTIMLAFFANPEAPLDSKCANQGSIRFQ